MNIIKSIRQGLGCDEELLKRAAIDPAIDSSIKELRGNLHRALTALSEDLYSKDTHFLFEFIQNADDNSYNVGVTPTLQISVNIDGNFLLIECNETGFTDANVSALCKVGASTKKGALGFIGEKGIGFKSVFKVANIVYVSSNNHVFKFDKAAELGMITPIPTSFPVARRTGWTQFYLQISHTVNINDLKRQLLAIRPTHLLFLRRLHILRVQITENGATSISEHAKIFLGQQSGIATLTSKIGQNVNTRRYIISKKMWPMSLIKEEKRKSITETEIVLAFPINQDGTPWVENQEVYAFLPMRSFNFKFLIQADFLTASSREDALTDKPWNKTLCDAVVSLFGESIQGFQTDENLKYTWLAYLPVGIANSFKHIESSIVTNLKKMRIFWTSDNVLDFASVVRHVPTVFQNRNGQALVSGSYFNQCRHLSPFYNFSYYGSQLKNLGVENMTAYEFLISLSNMGKALSYQSKDWLDSVCSILRNHFYVWRHGYYHWDHVTVIKSLPIVPLVGGVWARPADEKIFFKCGTADVPYDLSLRFIEDYSVGPAHRTFLQYLGIKEADASEIAKEILALHDDILRENIRRSTTELVKHAMFVFEHRIEERSLSRLLLHDRDWNPSHGSDLYMDNTDKLPLSKVFSNPAKFVHPDYLKAYANNYNNEWLIWLHRALGVNTAPRLVNGSLSIEFKNFLTTNSTEIRLNYLRDYWFDILQSANGKTLFMDQISDMVVDVDVGNSQRRLRETYLRTKVLCTFTNLPFLPIRDVHSKDWLFLRQLGVSFDIDAKLSVHCLLELDKSGPADIDEVSRLYKQLDARFDDDDGKYVEWIRSMFNENKLIYVPEDESHKWLSIDDVVWGGPSIMTSKSDIQKIYPKYTDFFTGCLQLKPAPDDILVNELMAIIEVHDEEVSLDEATEKRICKILLYVALLIDSKSSTIPSWLHRIINEPIFLVIESAKVGAVLRRQTDDFLIADSNEFKDIFSGQIPLAAYTPCEIRSLQPLLVHFNCLKYLSTAVTQVTHVADNLCEDSLGAELLLKKSKYLIRLISDKNSSYNQKTRTQKFKNNFCEQLRIGVQVFDTDDIHVTYALTFNDQVVEKIRPGDCLLSEYIDVSRQNRLAIYKKPSLVLEDPKVVEKIAEYLGIDPTPLLIIFRNPDNLMDRLMEMMKISVEPILSVNLLELDFEWMSQSKDGRKLPCTTISAPVKELHNSSIDLTIEAMENIGGSSLATYIRNPDWRHSVRNYISQISDAVLNTADRWSDIFCPGEVPSMEHICFSLIDAQDDETDYKDTTASAIMLPEVFLERTVSSQKLAMSPDSKTVSFIGSVHHPPLSSSRVQYYNSTETTDLVCFLGEFYVFKRFSHKLPLFDYKNWTSDRRVYANFPIQKSTSVSDFFYPDTQGFLTGILYGEEKKNLWENQWPEYFIEVKSTTGSLHNAFYMSESQLNTARMLSLRTESPEPPKQIYVLIRVYNISLSQLSSQALSWMIFPDPHQLIYDGQLRIISKVAICAQSSNT